MMSQLSNISKCFTLFQTNIIFANDNDCDYHSMSVG